MTLNNPSYLIKSRHDIYYFRYPLPVQVQGKSNRISMSLKTRCPREALRLAKSLEYHSIELIEKVDLKRMDHKDVMLMFKEYYGEVLEKAKQRIDKDGPLSKEQVQGMRGALEMLDELVEEGLDDAGELYGFDEGAKETGVHKAIARVMDRFDLNYEIGSKEYTMMKSAYKFAWRNHLNDLLAYSREATDYTLLSAQGEAKPIEAEHGLKDVLDGYLNEVKPNLVPRSFKEQSDCLSYLVDYFGEELSVSALDVSMVQDVKKALQSTPKGRNKANVTKGEPLKEQIEIAQERKLDVLSAKSVNKYLAYFSRLFDWARRNKFVQENVFEGAQVRGRNKGARREMFKRDEITLILDELRANSSGKVKNKSQYWGALIAIYTGARRNEISALMVDDVKQDQETGIWYFNIIDEDEQGKELKTEAARRVIPVHSKLLELGFIEYLEEAKEVVKSKPKTNGMETRLLYDLTYTSHDKWGRKLGQFMNDRLLVYLELHEKNRKTLHSLRHSFITHLNIEGVEVATIKSMVGHEQDTVTHKVYTHYGIEHLPQFKEAIEKLGY